MNDIFIEFRNRLIFEDTVSRSNLTFPLDHKVKLKGTTKLARKVNMSKSWVARLAELEIRKHRSKRLDDIKLIPGPIDYERLDRWLECQETGDKLKYRNWLEEQKRKEFQRKIKEYYECSRD